MTGPTELRTRGIALLTAIVFAASAGCEDATAPVVPAGAAADFDHEHPHAHSPEVGHEHAHDDFEGQHGHGHSHGHRHAEPTRGGQIVSVGHTHHEEGVDVFHAEVLPPADGRLVVELLVERGELMTPAEATGDSFGAIVGPSEGEAMTARNVTFSREGGSTFAAPLPETLDPGAALTVVVPKIELGGQRLNFSYQLAGSDGADDDAAAAADANGAAAGASS